MYRILSIVFTCFCFFAFANNSSAQSKKDSTEVDAVQLHSDPRLAILSKHREVVKTASANNYGYIRTTKGYRILIYSGTDRSKANHTKIDFMRNYPSTRIYMSYSLPQYRVKVGDFASRQDANDFYRELCKSYSPCMMVPDIVEINSFRKNDN